MLNASITQTALWARQVLKKNNAYNVQLPQQANTNAQDIPKAEPPQHQNPTGKVERNRLQEREDNLAQLHMLAHPNCIRLFTP